MQERLAALRAQVDEADAALVGALAARWRAVAAIAAHKRAEGIEGYDATRERALREQWRAIADREGLDRALCDAVFDVVIERCRNEVTSACSTDES
jgi:chorismate mutase